MIDGVALENLETHRDERGFFREIIRVTDDLFEEGFGQWSHSLMYPGVIKAWHIHNRQTDWWYVCTGVLKVVLYDKRPESSTYRQSMEIMLGDGHQASVLKIPPGVAHGCKCISGPVNLFYITSHTYDPEDEGRIPHDDREIGYEWLQGPLIR
ncbi:dTDP-4-dehydrorhamnose 3,5-epimerase family protein [Acidobacteria bacterium AH-259-L09]|nr:dTDP-4-dehydrorhamnose 3,5-epimerase family protein [Acidobacteria bacterium AH-259-L09]